MDNKKITVSSIKPEDTVLVKISGGFFSRLQALYFHIVKDFDEEQFKSLMTGILHKTKFKETESDAYNLQTIVTLLYSLEDEFKKAGLVSEKSVDMEKG